MTFFTTRPVAAAVLAALLLTACSPKVDARQKPSTATPRAQSLIEDGKYYEAIRAWQTEPAGADTDQRIKDTEKVLAAEIDRRQKRAISLQKRGRLGEAVRLFDECYGMDPRRDDMIPKSQNARSELARRKADLNKALEGRRAASDLEGSHEQLLKLNYLDPFDSGVRGELEDTEKQWRRELDSAMDAALKLYRNRSFDEAAPQFDRIVKKWPGHALAKNYLAQSRTDALSGAKTEKEKAEQSERARLATTVQALIAQADACQKSGDLRCALEKLNAALDEDPDSTLADEKRTALLRDLTPQTEEIYKKGLDYYRSEELNKAIEQWKLVLLINPNHDRARRDLQRAENMLKNFQKVPEGQKPPESGGNGTGGNGSGGGL